MKEDQFYGEPVAYWLALRDRVEKKDSLEVKSLILEVAELQRKVAFYESRIKQMAKVMEE